MATTTATQVVIYEEQFHGAFVETIQQNVDAFNEASRGALMFDTRELQGQYEQESFFDEVSNIARRDPTNDSSNTPAATALTLDEFIGVKLHRRNGPYEWNISAANLAGFDPEEFSLAVGEQAAVAIPQEMLDRVLGALEAKLDNIAALSVDREAASPSTLRTVDLANGLKNFGDKASSIICWVMHSVPFFDLLIEQLGSSASTVATMPWGMSLFEGTPVTLNRPVIVTDSTSLISLADESTGEPVYSTLGLTRRAAQATLSEMPLAVAEGPITGSDNLFIRWQSEYGYNVKLRGCEYNTGNGANPTDADVANASNWTTQVADNKLLPGVIIKTN